MRGEAEMGKSVPVLKEFRAEAILAPLTPEKPMANGKKMVCQNGQDYIMAETEDYLSRFTFGNRGEIPLVSKEVGSSSHCDAGFAWEANQAEQWAPLYTPPSRFSESTSRNSMMKETDPLAHWRGMTFSDLLALNHGLAIPMAGNQTSHGLFSNLDWQFSSTALMSENQESMGLRGSNIRDPDLIRVFNQTAEIQQKSALPNASKPVFAPETPDHCKRLQDNAVSWKTSLIAYKDPNKQNGEDNQVSVIDDSLGIQETHLATEIAIESYDPANGDNPSPDVNKTIEQKPRRRKHRPKVVKEAKANAKQTPKQRKPKPTDANETPKPKRKYVRKNKTNIPSTTPPECGAEALDGKIADPAVKSCRKALNFDLESQVVEKKSTDAKGTPKQKRKYVRKSMTNKPPTTPAESGADAHGCKIPCPAVKSCRKGLNFDLEDEVQDNHLSHRLTDTPPSEHFPQGPYPAKETDFITTATREDSAYDVFRNDQTIESCMSMSEREAHTVPHPTEATPTKHELNAATSLQKGCFTDTMHPRQFFASSPNYSTCGSSNEGQQIRGLKRANSCSAYVPNKGTESLAVHCTPSQENYMFLGNAIFSCTHGMYFPEIRKKRKPETVLKPKASQILSSADALEHISKTTSLQNPREPAKSSKYYYSVLAPHCNIGAEANSQASAVLSHQANTQLTNWGDIDKLKRSKAPTCVHDLHSQEGSEVCKKASRSPANGRVKGTRKKILKTLESHPKLHNAKQERRKSGKKNFVAKSVTSSFNMVYKHNPNLYEQHFTGNSNGPFLALPWTNTNITNVDDIIEGMKQLSINREGSSVQYQEQNTLVPYQVQNQQRNAIVIYQRDGVMIPFERTQSSKKSLRAKVDIDDETNRVWNLLLENINSQGIDGTDEEKTKWWEEERKVFRGRVDSFIARMRLVQGDRRFSPWKGSVVDSVVGVFLTQNVSDHLSSSAYMSLAARYPLKSAKKVRRDSEEEFSPSAKEQEICIVEIDDDSDNLALSEKTVEGLICDSNSRTFHDTDVSEEKVVNSEEAQLYRARSIKESETPCTSADERVIDDVTSSQHSVISSQTSVESPRKMVENGLSYDNSSEVEDPTNSSNPGSSHCSGSFVELLKMAEKPMLHATYSPIGQVPSSLSYSLDQEKVVKYGDPSHKAFRTKMDCFSNVLNKCSTAYQLHPVEEYHLHSVDEENRSVNSTRLVEDLTTEAHNVTTESATEFPKHKKASKSSMGPSSPADNVCSFYVLEGEEMIIQSTRQPVKEQQVKINHLIEEPILPQMNMKLPTVSTDNVATESTCASNSTLNNNLTPTQPLTLGNKLTPTQPLANHNCTSGEALNVLKQDAGKQKAPKKAPYDWDSLRKQAQANGRTRERTANTMDSLDWEAIRRADVNEIAYTIRERGMNNRLAERIKEFLDRLVNDHGSIDLEWLRDVPPDKAKEYLLSIKGLGLKSVECVRLLTLHHLAFPVDTNVGRIAVRLGWVPLQPLPESLQLHLLELYPILESIQKYLWPRLCKLDQRTLYELHYHMITFGKVFCTKRQPNCNACPLRGECRHFASAFASARLALPGPQDTSIIISDQSNLTHQNPQVAINSLPMPLLMGDQTLATKSEVRNCEPIVEIPASPEQEPEQMQTLECDIEDALSEDPNEIPTIKLNMEEFTQTLQAYMQSNSELQEGHMSKALVALAAEAASIPTRKLKNVSRLRTEHHVYELPDTHHLLRGLDKREPDDPCPYLLAIWSPGETANSTELPEKRCNFQEPGQLCSDETCFYCNSQREADSQIVRGTLLIPCRTAMRGSFPLNGTYFQVNEVFADQDSSLNPIQVPRALLWNLPRRTVYFGTSVPTIFKGLSTEGIQQCFWRGYVCVRGFDQKTRAPRPLMARLHFPASKSKARGKSSEQYS